MKQIRLVLTFVFMVALVGCESMGENTKKGAGVGALAGAAIGGIAGHQGGHGWEGALIGGAAGATAGGLIGNQMDKKAKGSGGYLSLPDVVAMAQSGASDTVIINEIQQSGSKYQLTSESINYLKNNGVSDAVINAMLNTTR